jgi:hypothetical protein
MSHFSSLASNTFACIIHSAKRPKLCANSPGLKPKTCQRGETLPFYVAVFLRQCSGRWRLENPDWGPRRWKFLRVNPSSFFASLLYMLLIGPYLLRCLVQLDAILDLMLAILTHCFQSIYHFLSDFVSACFGT